MATAACGGGSGSSNTSSGSGSSKTLTYWASNQGTSLHNDKDVLRPGAGEVQQQTGVKVNLRSSAGPTCSTILAATTAARAPTC